MYVLSIRFLVADFIEHLITLFRVCYFGTILFHIVFCINMGIADAVAAALSTSGGILIIRYQQYVVHGLVVVSLILLK